MVALAAGFCTSLSAQERCGLPAYAHNDYVNQPPLLEALESGYAGVEADVFLVGGRLLVGHEAAALRVDRTLKSLYLEPLRQVQRERNSICDGPKPFLLNIEVKQSSRPAFDSLRALLRGYADLVHPNGPVRVILVGWIPELDSLDGISIQHRVRSSREIDRVVSDARVALISVRYKDLFSWNGRGDPDSIFQARLVALSTRAHADSGRLLRVYDVPYSQRIYQMLLDGGVDLIGLKDLKRGRELLRGILKRTG